MIEVFKGSAWLLESKFFNQFSPYVIRSIRNGNDLPSALFTDYKHKAFKGRRHFSAGIEYSDGGPYESEIYHMSSGENILSIPLHGSLTKYGGMCNYGSSHYSSLIARAEADPEIDGFLLDADGPGGSVSGITRFSNTIAGTIKPIVSFVEEQAASAHYWTTSQSDYIIMNSEEYAEVGSIGVLAIYVNGSEFLKKEGIEVKILRADQSKDKALMNPWEELPENVLAEYQANLNKVADDFIAAVKSGRGDRLADADDEIFTGKMHNTDDALDLGMADEKGTKAQALELVADLAKSQKRKSITI